MKYIKWILLLSLIVCLVLFGIKFINYNNNDYKNNREFKIEDIYGFVWINKGFSYYNDIGELVVSEDASIDNHYIIFSSNEVSYCNREDDKCDKYTYNYNDGKITFNTDDFIYRGTYDIKFENDILELSISIDNTKMIYYFVYLLG